MNAEHSTPKETYGSSNNPIPSHTSTRPLSESYLGRASMHVATTPDATSSRCHSTYSSNPRNTKTKEDPSQCGANGVCSTRLNQCRCQTAGVSVPALQTQGAGVCRVTSQGYASHRQKGISHDGCLCHRSLAIYIARGTACGSKHHRCGAPILRSTVSPSRQHAPLTFFPRATSVSLSPSCGFTRQSPQQLPCKTCCLLLRAIPLDTHAHAPACRALPCHSGAACLQLTPVRANCPGKSSRSCRLKSIQPQDTQARTLRIHRRPWKSHRTMAALIIPEKRTAARNAKRPLDPYRREWRLRQGFLSESCVLALSAFHDHFPRKVKGCESRRTRGE
ncbi:hypothetical protein N657DRAFT_198199 [Parathielavia appendiculata]|uniref:Uncharacterized protein n=1 Tax=Parathielavia appendiculata TaxID=2587402 RepID=A0AAN6U6B6_9PEZI|nr:hypothetical protein N657DRAFT_198199 [Parathielavia appendiculata]